MKRLLISIFLIFTCSIQAIASFVLKGNNPVHIPFQFINNLIFIPINVNGVDLTFLLDSGVTETLLFSLENKAIDIEKYEKISFSGLGGEQKVEGLKADKINLILHQSFADTNHILYIILNEDFNISKHVGIPVNGIIGYQFFKDNVIGIDYIKKVITIYPTKHKKIQKIHKKYKVEPIEIVQKKPLINASAIYNNEVHSGKFLIDLGSNDAIWLLANKISNFNIRQQKINDLLGRGFNGDIYGKRTRIKELLFNSFHFKKPIIAIPDTNSISSLYIAPGRIGSIGSEILSRFYLVFDYPNNALYLKKNKWYNEPFHLNMSGIDIIQNGSEWSKEKIKLNIDMPYNAKEENGTTVFNSQNRFSYKMRLLPIYEVSAVRKGSPADAVGIQKGDRILSINNENTKYFTMQSIYNILGTKPGKKISMTILRENLTIHKTFYLKDPIPYQED